MFKDLLKTLEENPKIDRVFFANSEAGVQHFFSPAAALKRTQNVLVMPREEVLKLKDYPEVKANAKPLDLEDQKRLTVSYEATEESLEKFDEAQLAKIAEGLKITKKDLKGKKKPAVIALIIAKHEELEAAEAAKGGEGNGPVKPGEEE